MKTISLLSVALVLLIHGPVHADATVERKTPVTRTDVAAQLNQLRVITENRQQILAGRASTQDLAGATQTLADHLRQMHAEIDGLDRRVQHTRHESTQQF